MYLVKVYPLLYYGRYHKHLKAVSRNDHSPSEIIIKVNALVAESNKDQLFVTCFWDDLRKDRNTDICLVILHHTLFQNQKPKNWNLLRSSNWCFRRF